jgi:hypothetical protein
MRLDNKRVRSASLFLVLVFVCVVAQRNVAAQIDVPITAAGPIRTLARNQKWNTNGTGGINNNYLFTPVTTNESLCLSLVNGSASLQNVAVSVFGTEDQTVTAYQTNQSAWTLLGPTVGTLANFVALGAGSTKTIFVQINSQAKVSVVISGTGTAVSGATLLAVESPQTSGCGNITVAPVVCPFTAVLNVIPSGSSYLVPPLVGQRVYICNFTLSTSGATTAAGNITIFASTAVSCVQDALLFEVLVPNTTTLSPPWTYQGQPFVGGFSNNPLDLVGNGLCVGNFTTASVFVDYSYAQF